MLLKKGKNLNLYIEFTEMHDVRLITNCLKNVGVAIVDVEVEPGRKETQQSPSAVFYLRLKRRTDHAEILSAVFQISTIRKINEL